MHELLSFRARPWRIACKHGDFALYALFTGAIVLTSNDLTAVNSSQRNGSPIRLSLLKIEAVADQNACQVPSGGC